MTTLEGVAGVTILPVEARAARAWAAMRAYLLASERRVGAHDLWIAATAAAHGMPVLTQDGDFDVLSGVEGLTVVPV
jgi:predicted nucleic acid-binding protein